MIREEWGETAMNPDFINSRWWSTSVHYLAMAHFTFNRGKEEYSWYMLLGWAECLQELKEDQEQ